MVHSDYTPDFLVYYFQCKYVVSYRFSIIIFSIYGLIFPNIITTKFCKLHFLVLLPCNFHTYLCLLFCVQELLLFLCILQVFFPPSKFVFLAHKFCSAVYFLCTLLILDVFHQFQPPCYFLSFLLPFLHLL